MKATPFKVLLIEDSRADADLIGGMLAESNGAFVIEHVSYLSLGLERLEREDIDVILLDLSLPDSCRTETFARIHVKAPHIPTVVLSGLEDESRAVQAVREGAQDYLVKGHVNGGLLARALRYAIERHRTDVALRESEERYRTIVKNLNDALYIHDFEGAILDVNDRACKMLGYARAELVGANLSKIDSAEDAERLPERMSRLLEKGAILFEGQQVRKDGNLIPVEISAKLVSRENQGIIQGFARDITERKWADAEREHLWLRVQEQAQRVQQVVDTVPEGVILLDADRHVVLTNPLGQQDLAVLAQANVGDALTHLGDRPLEEFLLLLPGGLWHDLDADGRNFKIIASSIESGPASKGWVLVIRDVTRQRAFEHRAQQQERLAALGQLAAGIAHDFNNILAVISLYAGIMLQTPARSAKDYERLDIIREQTQRASDLIRGVLDFSRHSMLERGPLDLGIFLKEQVKLLQRTLPEHIAIELSYDQNEYVLNADPTRIQQSIMNLATNARDAMPEGGRLHIGLERVRVTERRSAPLPEMEPGEWVCVKVADSGMGIPAEVLPHIFDPFFTTKAPGKGTGLGLSQVYGIVRQHEGYVDVESKMGAGTVFTLYLPALAAPAAELSASSVKLLIQGEGDVILVVEDEETTRQAIVGSLEMLGYRVLAAANGREALALFAQRAVEAKPRDGIALVLSDMIMPEMGGRALLQALKQRDPAVRVLLLTGHPLRDEELKDLRALGITGWLFKPPSIEQLSEAVAQALQENCATTPTVHMSA